MFSWIIGSSLKFRFLVLATAAVMLAFGLYQLPRMPVDVFPEFAPPKVEIQTEGPACPRGWSVGQPGLGSSLHISADLAPV